MIELADVQQAARRLEGVAHVTPVLTSRTLDERVGGRVLMKAENLQRGGAFKFRGAYNAIASLPDDQRERGVVAVSSGNHAQAVAIAAGLLGTRATILMPEDAPPAKLEATRGYGAEIVIYDRYASDRDDLLADEAANRGRTAIHPYDDPNVMAGQGTVALELINRTGHLDALVVPVGGGGLISGCSTVVKAWHPSTRVIGVEPEAGDDTKRSFEAGERVTIPVPRTIADGQQVPSPGELTFAVIRERVDEIVTVSDAELVDAMAFAFDRLKIVLEPSGACALAALMTGRASAGDQRVGMVLSGGNVGLARFLTLMADGA